MSNSRLVVGTAMLATVSSVYPGFLIGALSVQVSEDFGVSEGTYGWGLGSFFLAATAGSVVLGRLAQRIGPRTQIAGALAVSGCAELVLAGFARSFAAVIACLFVAGFTNAGNQTAVNLALARADISRLGLAVALKQSGMPTASLLSGFAVPVLALTVGWRWAFVMGAVMALVALIVVLSVIQPTVARAEVSRPELVSPMGTLVRAAVCHGFFAFSAGALNAWVVGSGVDAGLSPGVAGVMLGVGAGCGIALRMYSGFRADTMRSAPFRVAGLTVLVGAVGMAALTSRVSGVHMIATVVAFAGGWIWPVFTNYGIMRTNPLAAGAATGVSQTGVYVGVFLAPLVTGWLIELSGYQLMWTVVAASAVVGSILSVRLGDQF